MASGQEHDKSTKLWSVPFGLVIGILFGFKSGVIASISFTFGGLWLSPDLDTYSKALKRWGLIQFIWWPYRKAIPHRSVLSHGPFIGTAFRIIYLICIAVLMILISESLGGPKLFLTIQTIQELFSLYKNYLLIAFFGIEASAWLHLIKDGDPLPHEWHKWNRR